MSTIHCKTIEVKYPLSAKYRPKTVWKTIWAFIDYLQNIQVQNFKWDFPVEDLGSRGKKMHSRSTLAFIFLPHKANKHSSVMFLADLRNLRLPSQSICTFRLAHTWWFSFCCSCEWLNCDNEVEFLKQIATILKVSPLSHGVQSLYLFPVMQLNFIWGGRGETHNHNRKG